MTGDARAVVTLSRRTLYGEMANSHLYTVWIRHGPDDPIQLGKSMRIGTARRLAYDTAVELDATLVDRVRGTTEEPAMLHGPVTKRPSVPAPHTPFPDGDMLKVPASGARAGCSVLMFLVAVNLLLPYLAPVLVGVTCCLALPLALWLIFGSHRAGVEVQLVGDALEVAEVGLWTVRHTLAIRDLQRAAIREGVNGPEVHIEAFADTLTVAHGQPADVQRALVAWIHDAVNDREVPEQAHSVEARRPSSEAERER